MNLKPIYINVKNRTHAILIFFGLIIIPFSVFPSNTNKIDSLRNLLTNAHTDTARVNLLVQLCDSYISSNDSLANLYGHKALHMADSIHYLKGLGNAFCYLGKTNYFHSDYDSAKKNFTDGLHIFQALGNKKGISKCYNGLGLIYHDKTNYPKALEYYLKGLAIQQQIEDSYGMESSFIDIAIIYYDQNNIEKSLEYNKKALDICKKINDTEGFSTCYTNVGVDYDIQKKYDQALACYRQSLSMDKHLNDLQAVGNDYANIGYEYDNMGKKQLALKYYNKALEVNSRKDVDNQAVLTITYTNIGDLYSELHQYGAALASYNKGLALATELGSKDDMQTAYKGLSETYAKMKNYKKAYQYHCAYKKMADAIFNQSSSDQLHEMQVKYETSRKEQQIKLLKKDRALQDAEIAQKNAEVKQQVFERNAVMGGLGLVMILSLVVFRSYTQKRKANKLLALQKGEIEFQKNLLEEKNKDITDSINYAKNIQHAIFTSDEYLKSHLPDYFLFYLPKDIVSGDFYWAMSFESKNKNKEQVLVATADCTGHGVPGALMSVVGNALLNEITIEKGITRPDLVLNKLRIDVIKALNPEGSKEKAHDGMDIALCLYDFSEMKLQYAAANNPVYRVRDGQLEEFPADKYPVGEHGKEMLPFTLREIDLQKGDIIYTFSDGYADQFGGSDGKKLKYKKFKEILQSISSLDLEEQKKQIEKHFVEWKGQLVQIDDILVMGVKV